MLTQYFKSPSRIRRFLSGPGGPQLEAFSQYLDQSGYSNGCAGCHIRAAEHLLYWMYREGASFSSLDEMVLERFAEHLNRCQCQGFSHMSRLDLLRGARVFLTYQRSVNTDSAGLTAPPVDHEPVLFSAFCQWMRQQRGTTDPTLYCYGHLLRGLLENVGDNLGKLDAQYLQQFILEQSQKKGCVAAKQCTKALRMFIRFLIAEGKCAVGLDAAVPVVAHWRLSTLPQYLQADEIERVIASCDPKVPAGRRDRAILLLLARMGFRAGDILQLRIGDIDWQGATISVSGKSKRQTRLPLTQEVGQAIVEYLQQGRPRTDSDRLFIRSRAPFRAIGSNCTISDMVKQSMRRAGVTCSSRGAAHLLRHSAATSMLRNGASLQDIAAILRHSSITTTQIYAKVDVTTLREIVQLWPEELSC